MNAASRPASTVALAGVTVATAVSFGRVFADWAYLRPMLTVAVGVHVVAALLRRAGVRWWAAIPAMSVAAAELVAVVYYRDTLTALVPTGRTWAALSTDIDLVIRQFSTAVAPVTSRGSFAILATAMMALVAILTDTFAFRLHGRIEALVPAAAVFLFTSLLATDRHRVGVTALWIATALAALAIMRVEGDRNGAPWMGGRVATFATIVPTVALVIPVGALAASAVAPHLPGADKRALVDTRNRDGSVTEVLSPLVDIRAQMVNRSNLAMFDVESSSPHYWRMISLPGFDGSQWTPPAENLVAIDATIATGHQEVATFTIRDMSGHLVPAAYRPVAVSGDDVSWAPDSESLVLTDGVLESGDQLTVTSVIPDLDPAVLAASTVSSPPSPEYLALPDGVPREAYDQARSVTSGATSAFEVALDLQNWFRTEFTYDLNVQIGESNDAISVFLRDRRGFCQQFAGTFAVMARALGLPSRVAVGFTAGDRAADGSYRVFGRHAHAWPEVWFDGIGWVAFEPTPSRGSADTAQYTGVTAAQDDDGGGSTAGATVATPRPANPAPRPGELPSSGREGVDSAAGRTSGAATTPSTTPTSGWAGADIALIALGIALVLWLLAGRRLVDAYASRHRGDSRTRVITAWQRSCRALEFVGAPAVAGCTPREYALVAEQAVSIDHRTLRELADYVTAVVYAETDPGHNVADRCERLGSSVVRMCRERASWGAKLRADLDPRLMLRLARG